MDHLYEIGPLQRAFCPPKAITRTASHGADHKHCGLALQSSRSLVVFGSEPKNLATAASLAHFNLEVHDANCS